LSFAGIALADDRGSLPPPPCAPKNWKEVTLWREWGIHTSSDNPTAWFAEAQRMSGNPNVWRWLDRLYLQVDGGNVVTLADCPFTDGTYTFLYERYDEAGAFYVVLTAYYEDRVYALVMKKTGRLHNVPALPVWSPDKTRFAYAACSVMNGKDDLAIMKPEGEGRLKVETENKIPCGMGDCEIVWESNTVLTVTCLQTGDQGKENRAVRLTLSGAQWQSTPSTAK
jgi:hypothetical protein